MNQVHTPTITQKKRRSQTGQSLVEVALFFPIFVILLAGVVEVANILVTQNRVTSATRASTRFAADGGEDAGIATVALNTVTQTLETSEDVWDIWSIRGEINDQGNGFVPNTWQFTHIYGISNTTTVGDVDESAIQAQVLDELQRDQNGNKDISLASGLRFVGTYAIHDIESILGLNALPQFQNLMSVQELTVMRITAQSLQNTNGCTGFPIAVNDGIRSVTQALYPTSATYPATMPNYNTFVNHTPNVPLSDAEEGDLFLIQNGFGSGNFGWIRWNDGINPSAQTLEHSLTWPGDSDDYTPLPNGDVRGYIEPGDNTDRAMHIGDWVSANTGSVNASGVRAQLNQHVSRERTLRVIIWDQAQQQGQNGQYHIVGFGIFRLIAYQLSQSGGSWILAEFIRMDNSCGQQTQGGAP